LIIQQRKRKRCWFRTATAAARVSRDACQGCKLVMIDSLDWWTCRTRYYMCYRERCRLTIDQKREYACGAEYLLRLQYTSLSNFMTGDFDTWWMNANRPFRMSHFRSPMASCRRTCVVNMWAFIDVKFVGRANTIPLENFAFPESFLLNKFLRKNRANNEKDLLNF